MKNNLSHVRALIMTASLLAVCALQSHAGTLSVTNGSFTNLTGLTDHGGGWYGGEPAGWTTDSSVSSAYTVLNSGGTYYANLQTLGPASPFTPLQQNVGTVDVTSDVVITFTLNTLSGTSTLGSGLYDLALAAYTSPLASYSSGSITGASSVSYSAKSVGPGTALYLAFWNGSSAAGISGISISDTATTYSWDGGVSGVWTNSGGGWTDKFDGAATNYDNAKPVVVQFTNASAGTNVTVAANGVVAGNVQVDGGNYTIAGGTVTMTNTTWSVAAARTNTVGSSLAGTTGLIKSDSGTLALAASNSYSGTTAVNAGTLTIVDGNALGSTAAGTTVASGAQLRLNATNSGFTIGDEVLTISGQGVTTGGALRNAAGNNTVQGKVTLAANATIGAAGSTSLTLDVASGNAIEASNFNLTFDGAGTNVISDAISLGTGGLTKIGSGRTILAVSNSYSGGTTISNGTLLLQNANALGSGAVAVDGGTLDLGGNSLTAANLSGTGGTVSLGAATLTASNTSGNTFAGSITGTGGLLKTGSSFLTLSGSNSYSGGTTINEGTIFLTGSGTVGAASGSITKSNSASTASLDLRNAQTRTGAITMIGQGARLESGDVNNPGSLINNGSALEMGGGQISVSVSGTGGLNVTGGGQITSSNSYTGATTVSATDGWYGQNTLFVANANALGAASGDLTISGGSVNLQGNTITRSGNVTITEGTINNGTLSKSGGNIDLQGGAVNAVLSGTAGLTKSGNGTATLSASNAYSGGTVVTAGSLRTTNGATLGDASGAVTVSNAVLELGNTQTRTGTISTIGQDARISGTGSLVNNGGALQFGGGLISVSVSGTGGLNVTGGGSLSASNSYSGATTISATPGWYGTQTLYVDHANALGAASGDLTISGGIVSLSSNTVARSGNVTISGGYVHSGTLSKSGGVYDIQGGEIAVALSGTAGLTKSGAGTATLSEASTYSGATAVENGALVVNGSLASATTVKSGASLGGSGLIYSATIESGGTIAPGNSPGTLTLTNGLTWQGGGNYNWQIFSASGTAGQTNTWDLINVTGGTWDITGLSSSNKFNINLWSLSGLPDSTGLAAGFDATQTYSWKILSSVGLSTTFDANFFNINSVATNGTGGFVGATGLFSLAVDGNDDLFLTYTGTGAAVPEPGTWISAALLVLGAAYARRRRAIAKSVDTQS